AHRLLEELLRDQVLHRVPQEGGPRGAGRLEGEDVGARLHLGEGDDLVVHRAGDPIEGLRGSGEGGRERRQRGEAGGCPLLLHDLSPRRASASSSISICAASRRRAMNACCAAASFSRRRRRTTSARSSSGAGGEAGRFSSNLNTWKPYGLETTSLTSPGFNPKHTSPKVGGISSLAKKPRSPPFFPSGEREVSRARSSKD